MMPLSHSFLGSSKAYMQPILFLYMIKIKNGLWYEIHTFEDGGLGKYELIFLYFRDIIV
jgi:hypothetical protein